MHRKEYLTGQESGKLNALLFGDQCVDEYQYGVVDRISPEAPVPIFKPTRKEYRSGMGANVEENLRQLGVTVWSYLGTPSTKTRLIDERYNHQLIRVDSDTLSSPIKFESVDKKIKPDVIVVSDYDKGSIDATLINNIKNHYHCPVFVDTKKKDLSIFDGFFVKINEHEEKQLMPHRFDRLIVTHGSGDVVYKGKTYPVKPTAVFDVTGAGDTFLAALAYQYSTVMDIDKSIKFAIDASAVTVKHMGVYAPTLGEIQNAT